MDPKALLDQGHLNEAIQATSQALRDRPADISLRVMLFELLCFEGAFDRAAKQLDIIATQRSGPAAEMAVQTYRDLIAAEQRRHAVFHADALPKFMLEPPVYADQYLVIVKKLRQTPKDAVALLPSAEEAFPSASGTLGGGRFAEFRDADDRVGPMLEVFYGPDYIWVPIEQISRLEIAEPRSLRDLMWARASLELVGQPAGDVFVPALYIDSQASPDPNVRLGRTTEWTAIDEQLVCGAGRRMMLVDGNERSILELRDVLFDRPSAAEARA